CVPGCTERFVGDSQRGLYCDYSTSYPGGSGECVNPVERPSERERLRQDFGGDAAHSQGQCLSSNCIEQITDWSLCSRSCGPGVSTRSSNQNWACRPQTQTILCQVRLCQPTAVQRSRSQEVSGSQAASSPFFTSNTLQILLLLRLSAVGFVFEVGSERVPARAAIGLLYPFVWSTRAVSARGPIDPGSVAYSVQTVPHQDCPHGLRCPQGRMSHQQVMMIESCSCHHYNCPQSPLTAYRRAIPWL
ncbi:unnamed protein product, partial [Coregonus sp. 'balchen']